MIATVQHLRLALDELEHRAEAARSPEERRRLLLDVVALERALAAAIARSPAQSRAVETIGKRLHRLRGAC